MVTINKDASTVKMSQQEIESYCKTFLKKAYDLELDIPILINSRIINTLGKFVHSKPLKKPLRIEFSKKYLIHGELEDILSTIKHECIHYALYMLKKPYRDGEEAFESELRKHGSHSTRTSYYKMERNINVYKCNCKEEHTSLRALSNSGKYHTCVDCKSGLVFVGKRRQLM